MSSGAQHRLIDKKGKQLSKFLGIDSVPSSQLIATMQARINNPLFKLSMTDYEAMCGNKTMVRMMSKVIGCEEKQLKKFCKYINVFAENIESSPKSIKNKMKVTNSINASKRRGSLRVLPDDILEKIVEKYKTIFKIKYKLKDWIPHEKLDWDRLSSNPNAMQLLKANPSKINWGHLSGNPSDEAIEILKTNLDEIYWAELSRNTNRNAIELLKANQEKINWKSLSINTAAIELLKENQDKIDWYLLSRNSNQEAIKLLKANQENIYWPYLSSNPNDGAIELLKENKTKIDWGELSANPNSEAIELLKKRLKYLRKLSDAEYHDLSDYEYLDWDELSSNPNSEAIKLLKANPDEINWHRLSLNPSAIELLKANPKKIDWEELSGNPAIFEEVLV